jgi:cytochrome c556
MRYFLIIILLSLVSCNSSETKKPEVDSLNKNKEKFVPELYEVSEMTLMMRNMYDVNEVIKKDILAGNTPEEFPKDFLAIFTAKLTDNKPHNETFIAYSKVYIDNVSAIYDSTSTIPLKNRYNNAINSCISCHTTECTGPIPRIKKLLIN